MVYLLLSFLFICNLADIEHFDHGWYIQRKGEVTEREAKYDCKKFGILCSEKNCLPFANKMKTLPTEDVTKSKTDIINAEKGDLKLLCLSNNFLRVTKGFISGIIQQNGTLDWASIVAQTSGDWKVEILKRQKNDALEKEKAIREQDGDQESHELPCTAAQTICDNNLESCIQNQIEYPYLFVDVNRKKFNRLAVCDDRGQVDGSQCTEVLCTEKGGVDDDSNKKPINMGIPAIVKCQQGNIAHLIYYHKSRDRWCLSQYHFSEGNDEKYTTLKQMLQKQVVDEKEIKYLLKQVYDPKVQSYWFWGDAAKAIEDLQISIPSAYKQLLDNRLINYELTFDQLNTQNYKNIFKEFRQCSFAVTERTDKNKNCNDKTVTPWDLLQLAINQGVLPSAFKQTTDVPKNSATKSLDVVDQELDKADKKNAKKDAKRQEPQSKLKPDDVAEEAQENIANNFVSMSVLSIVIPIVLILISGFYFFYI